MVRTAAAPLTLASCAAGLLAAVAVVAVLGLRLAVVDRLTLGLLAGLMLAEVGLLSWADSAPRRLLDGSASSRADLWCCAMVLTHLSAVTVAVATLGGSVWLSRAAGAHALPGAAGLPAWVAFPALLLVGSFCTYWTHRLLHTRLFWPLHVFHHAAERFTVATTYRVHPLDLATGFLSKLIIPLLLGFRPDLVLAGAVVFKVQALYAHSNLPEQPWLGRWLSFGPRGHGLHHSLDPRHRDRNFGSFVLWDRLFGTYLAVDGPQPAIGIDDGRERDLCLGQHPLRVMVVLQVDWACGLLRAARSRFARPADLSR